MKLRPALAADLPAILLLERATPTAPHWPLNAYRAALDEEGGPMRRRLLVASSGGMVLGFALASAIAAGPTTGAELETIAVRQEAQHQGIGRALLREAIAWCRAQGAATLDLEVRAASAGPQRLYRSAGFWVVGCRPGYYVDPTDDALCMRLELGPGVAERPSIIAVYGA